LLCNYSVITAFYNDLHAQPLYALSTIIKLIKLINSQLKSIVDFKFSIPEVTLMTLTYFTSN